MTMRAPGSQKGTACWGGRQVRRVLCDREDTRCSEDSKQTGVREATLYRMAPHSQKRAKCPGGRRLVRGVLNSPEGTEWLGGELRQPGEV